MSNWTPPGDARVALSVVVNVEEGAEMRVSDGDKVPEPVDELGVAVKKPIRNYGNESNYLYGIKAGAPRVFGLLQKHQVKATVTAAALSLERAPSLVEHIISGGHETCSHGWRWVHQFHMDEEQERNFIRKSVSSIEKTTGKRPTGWLSRYLLTENTRRLLVEEGFAYHMDDYSGDVPFWDTEHKNPIVIVPYAVDTNDMKMWVAPAFTPKDWLDYAIDTFDCLYEEGGVSPKMMSLGLHLRIIGRPGRIAYLDKFLQHALSHNGVWAASREEIARSWAEQNPA